MPRRSLRRSFVVDNNNVSNNASNNRANVSYLDRQVEAMAAEMRDIAESFRQREENSIRHRGSNSALMFV